jgi:hypothetical protein
LEMMSLVPSLKQEKCFLFWITSLEECQFCKQSMIQSDSKFIPMLKTQLLETCTWMMVWATNIKPALKHMLPTRSTELPLTSQSQFRMATTLKLRTKW